MKIQEVNTGSYVEKGIQDSTKFGIKDEDMSHILSVLRDSLYSDKIGAVIREYSCNAVDANVEAGNGDKPIKVTLPTALEEVFKIRDFGFGLTHDEIFEIYSKYGRSTKRHSNDYIGMLGIGSKSAFAYGDNFLISTFKDGTKTVYNAYIDPSRRGVIAKIHEEETDEPSGVEIEVAVKGDDVDDFRDKAYEIFQHYKVTPDIVNPDNCNEGHYLEGREVILSGEGWEFNAKESSDGDPVLIMGNVAYPIKQHLLGDIDEDVQAILSGHLTVEVTIGEVEISANRESLQYTDATKKAILARLKSVAGQIVDSILNKFGESDTVYAAKVLWSKTFSTDGPFYSFRNLLNDKLHVGGQPINDAEFKLEDEDATVYGIKDGRKRSTFKEQYRNVLRVDDDRHIFIVNDHGHNRGAMKRVLPLDKEDGRSVNVITLLDGDNGALKGKTTYEYAKRLKEMCSYDGPFSLLSELPERDISQWQSNTSSSTSKETRRRNNTKIVKLIIEGVGCSCNVQSDHWEAVSVDLDQDSGVYLHIDRYMVMADGYERKVHFYEDVFSSLKALGVKVPTIYGVKSAWIDKVNNNPNWISFSDWVSQEVQNLMTPEVKEAMSYHVAWRNSDLDNSWYRLFDKIEVGLNNESSLVADLAYEARQLSPKNVIISDKDKLCVRPDTLYSHVEKALRYGTGNGYNWTENFEIDDCKYDIDKTFKKVIKKYPMLRFVSSHNIYKREGMILDYLNMVDSSTPIDLND